MANSILQGNMPFDRSVYSKADVDKIVEEHSRYVVSPAGNTYVRPMDNGTGVIDRTVETHKYLSMTCSSNYRVGIKAPEEGEEVWHWIAPDPPEGQENYVFDFVGPFTSKTGDEVYVPSTSAVFDGFDPEAFYATLWAHVEGEGDEAVWKIQYKGFPQWFTFSDRDGSFIGHDVVVASGSVDGTYYDDGAPTNVISDSRILATMDDVGAISASEITADRPIRVSAPIGDVNITHDESGVTAGEYGVNESRRLAPGESFNVPSHSVDATGHITSDEDVELSLPNGKLSFGAKEFDGSNDVYIDATDILMGYDSNDRTVSDVIEEIQEEIGGGGDGSIGERLDRLDAEVTDLSNDIATHEHSYIVNGSTKVQANDDGTASIDDTSRIVPKLVVPDGFSYKERSPEETGAVEFVGPYGDLEWDSAIWIPAGLDREDFNIGSDPPYHIYLIGREGAVVPESVCIEGNTIAYSISGWPDGVSLSRAGADSDYSGGDISVTYGPSSRRIATVDDVNSKADEVRAEAGTAIYTLYTEVAKTQEDLSGLSNDVGRSVTELKERDSALESMIDDLSNDVNSRLDDLSNDIGEAIDTKLTEIEGRIDDLSNDLYSAIDDFSNDVSLRAMDDNVVHKTGPLVEGQTIDVPIDIQTGSLNLVEASGFGVTTTSIPDIGKPEIRTWFWGNDNTVEGSLGASISLILSPNDRRGVELAREVTWDGDEIANSASIWYGDNEIKIPEKSGTIALEEYMPVPSDETPKMDGTASPGTGAQASRWDHVHPSDSSKLDVADVASRDISYLAAPLYVDMGSYHEGDIVRTSYDIAPCIGGSYFRAKKDTVSATDLFSSGDWCDDSKRNEYWEALGNSAAVSRGEIVSYKGDLYRVRSDAWLTNADYSGDFQAELDFYLEKIDMSDDVKSYIENREYGSRVTIEPNEATVSYYEKADLVPFSLVIPDGFKLYWENSGSGPHQVVYSAPSGGTTISFSTPPIHVSSYDYYILVPDGYTFVDMDTMLSTDNLLWFNSVNPNSDSWGLSAGSSTGGSGDYLAFDCFLGPHPIARYTQFGIAWANKIPEIRRATSQEVVKTVATVDQMPAPASETPLSDVAGGSVGVSEKYAREDHAHPLSDRIVSPDGDTTVAASNGKVATITYPTDTTTSVFFPEGFSITSYGVTYSAPSGGETITFKGPYKMVASGYGNEYVWYPTNLPNDPQEQFDPANYDPWPWCLLGQSSDTAGSLRFGGNFGFDISNWGSKHPTLAVDERSEVSGTTPTMTRSGSSFVTRNLAFEDHAHSSIVSGDTTVSAVNGGTATITKTVPPTYGNMVVTFPADYSITDGYATYTGPGTVEFKGPYYNPEKNYSFWYPTDLQDDPGASFDPANYHVWCLTANGDKTVSEYMMYETGPSYNISEWNSAFPKLALSYGTVSGSKPQTSRSSTPSPSVVKTIATTDNVVLSVNGARGDVSLDATNLYMDSTQTQSIAQAIASIPGGGSIQSVNGDTGPDVHLDATNLYMDSNDQVTIAEAMSGFVTRVNDVNPDPNTGSVWLMADDIMMGYESNDIPVTTAIENAQLSPLYSENRESSIVVTNSGYPELHASRVESVSLLIHENYSVSYGNVSYSTVSEVTIPMDGAYERDIDGDKYYFWLPTTVQDPSEFNPFDGSSESVWYFWKQVDPADPDSESIVPEFLSYANGPQYTVNGWYTDNTTISLIAGSESGDSPDTVYGKYVVSYKLLSYEDLSYDIPFMDGDPTYGSSSRLARADHVHPSDSRKVSQGNNHRMSILPDGSVSIVPMTYVYETSEGISASDDSITTVIPAGSPNGGVFCRLRADESLDGASYTGGSLQIFYRVPVQGETDYSDVHLLSADVAFTRSSSTSHFISVSNIVSSGEDANGVAFDTTTTYQYITGGSSSVIDYTATGGSFVINCGPLTWVSGGPNPNTTIEIPSTKTLATTKYVDDAIGDIDSVLDAINGEVI